LIATILRFFFGHWIQRPIRWIFANTIGRGLLPGHNGDWRDTFNAEKTSLSVKMRLRLLQLLNVVKIEEYLSFEEIGQPEVLKWRVIPQ
jgi:hypothetical protein